MKKKNFFSVRGMLDAFSNEVSIWDSVPKRKKKLRAQRMRKQDQVVSFSRPFDWMKKKEVKFSTREKAFDVRMEVTLKTKKVLWIIDLFAVHE